MSSLLCHCIIYTYCGSRSRSWVNFLTSGPGAGLTLSCLSQCAGLNSLYIQHIATDDMLRVVSNTCPRLTLLDISFSSSVTDIGLVYLCGPLVGAGPGAKTVGCKYLRELYFNPQNQPIEQQIMPTVISCLLRHLPMLQVQKIPFFPKNNSSIFICPGGWPD